MNMEKEWRRKEGRIIKMMEGSRMVLQMQKEEACLLAFSLIDY